MRNLCQFNANPVSIGKAIELNGYHVFAPDSVFGFRPAFSVSVNEVSRNG